MECVSDCAVLFRCQRHCSTCSRPTCFCGATARGWKPSQFEQLRELTVLLLRFVAAYCLFDATSITFVGEMPKGREILVSFCLVTLATAIPPVIIGWIGINLFDLGLIWCWVVITTWICSLGVIYLIRFPSRQMARYARHRAACGTIDSPHRLRPVGHRNSRCQCLNRGSALDIALECTSVALFLRPVGTDGWTSKQWPGAWISPGLGIDLTETRRLHC